MKLICEDHGDVTIMRLKGDFVAEEVERFEQMVEQRFAQGQVRDFVLDCSEVEFVDSRGLEAMIWLQDRCAENLGQMRLAGMTENVCTILEMTRLAPRFDCHPGVEPAVASLR